MAAWEAHAACREIGPETFMGGHYSPAEAAPAKDICRGCPVRRQCLAAAMAEEAGTSRASRDCIRGGLTPAERYRLDRRWQYRRAA